MYRKVPLATFTLKRLKLGCSPTGRTHFQPRAISSDSSCLFPASLQIYLYQQKKKKKEERSRRDHPLCRRSCPGLLPLERRRLHCLLSFLFFPFFQKVFPCCGFVFPPPFLFSSCVPTALLSKKKKSVFLVSRVQPR